MLEYALEKYDIEYYYFFLFIYFSGTRLSETFNILRADINIKEKTIKIKNKTDKTQFDLLPISQELDELIKKIIKLSQSKYLFSYNNKFRSPHGHLLNRLQSMQKALNIVEKYRGYHAFRRTLYNDMIANNVQFDIIKMQMRHKSLDVGIQHYLNDSHIHKAVDSVSQIHQNTEVSEIIRVIDENMLT